MNVRTARNWNFAITEKSLCSIRLEDRKNQLTLIGN